MALDLDPGTAELGNPRLIEAIIEEIAGGAIPFERFMELAQYHPEYGYYRKPGRIGPQGDFLTSPSIHPLFGWVVGAWCRWTWQELGEPEEFWVIEPGAGSGQLASAVLDWAAGRTGDAFGKALRYHAIEPHSPGSDRRVTWAGPPGVPAANGVVVSNEFFDALPVRLFEATQRGPAEVYVAWNGERFIEVGGPIAMIEDAPQEGRFEVSPRAYPTFRTMAGWLERGAILTFDYGYDQETLWAPWRKNGTLLCFYRHTAHEDPYIHVGEQDLTAHVNFSELASAADDEGYAVHGPVSQAEFLQQAGAGGLVEAVRNEMAEYFVRRRAYHQLIDTAGLGRIRVMAALRGIEGTPPGFDA